MHHAPTRHPLAAARPLGLDGLHRRRSARAVGSAAACWSAPDPRPPLAAALSSYMTAATIAAGLVAAWAGICTL
jgi:hypothetical protein